MTAPTNARHRSDTSLRRWPRNRARGRGRGRGRVAKPRRLRRHLATSVAPPPASARHPALRASTGAECNAVHCRPNTVFRNESPAHFPAHSNPPSPTSPLNITHTPDGSGLAWRGSPILSLPCGRRCVSISLSARGGETK